LKKLKIIIMANVTGLYISQKRGIDKTSVSSVNAIENWGIESDAHAGDWDRHVSIFPEEAMHVVPKEKREEVQKGGFTENITIAGLSLTQLCIGAVISIGTVKIKILYIGKEIYKEYGRSYIVSREGRFGVVMASGTISLGDSVIFA